MSIFGKTNPNPVPQNAATVKRYGSVIGLKPEMEEYYRELHTDVWEGVLERLKKSNIQNYSIYIAEIEGKKYLYSYFEYVGNDYEADSKSITEDAETQRWWTQTDSCQIQLPSRKDGANWSELEMVFQMD